ncbi:unnamed protein product [Calypogeia fissa]
MTDADISFAHIGPVAIDDYSNNSDGFRSNAMMQCHGPQEGGGSLFNAGNWVSPKILRAMTQSLGCLPSTDGNMIIA